MSLLAQLDIQDVVACAKQAGGILKTHFYSAFAHRITVKPDQSPVTQADLEANDFIVGVLSKLTPSVPILSEESKAQNYAQRAKWQSYWLIDPLDGTKGFIRRNPYFCVNIALIENHEPVLGVIYSPIEKYAVFASKNTGAYYRDETGLVKRIRTVDYNSKLRLFCGQFDHHAQFRAALGDCLGNAFDITRMNSALKFAVIARGLGDLYVRLGPTCEWDTAAGQCIVEEAGGLVVDFEGRPLQYNAKPSLINPSFLAMGDASQCDYFLNMIRKIL